MRKIVLSLIWLSMTALPIAAQENELRIPAEVAPFVEKGTKAIALETADLNGDRREDFILVLEKEKPELDKYDLPAGQRPLLILVRGADGKLVLAKRNERIILCSECGGVLGDPFVNIEVEPGIFTVNHYGGSNWRWSYIFQFNYSRLDKTWQLVRVEEASFHTSEPDKQKIKKSVPPKDFGKIDIANFDPEKILNKAAKPNNKK